MKPKKPRRVVLGEGYARFNYSGKHRMFVTLSEGLVGGHAYQTAILNGKGVDDKKIRLVAEFIDENGGVGG